MTPALKNAAVEAGRFQERPVFRIYTAGDYFAERKPNLPLAACPLYGVALFDVIAF